ncbi:MAG: cache domain-containing protein [Bdellovibrionia bacterium]
MHFITTIAALLFSSSLYANNNCTEQKKLAVCTESSVQERVDWACTQLAEQGKTAILKINSMRFECCGEPNYVWVNDYTPKMIVHPMRPVLNGVDLSDETDPKGVHLFKEFVAAAQKSPQGSWVQYQWTKFGEKNPTTKKSWIRACKAKDVEQTWVVGSGTWE